MDNGASVWTIRGLSHGHDRPSRLVSPPRRRRREPAAQWLEAQAHAPGGGAGGARADQRCRSYDEHLAAGRFAHDRRDREHPGRRHLRKVAARHSPDALWRRPGPPGPLDPARDARGRPRDRRPQAGQGWLGLPGRRHRAGDPAGGAGDPHGAAPPPAGRDQRPGRDEPRPGARAAGLAPRFHHRPHSRRPQPAPVRKPHHRRREGLPDRPQGPPAGQRPNRRAGRAQPLRLGVPARRLAAQADRGRHLRQPGRAAARPRAEHQLTSAHAGHGGAVGRHRAGRHRRRPLRQQPLRAGRRRSTSCRSPSTSTSSLTA